MASPKEKCGSIWLLYYRFTTTMAIKKEFSLLDQAKPLNELKDGAKASARKQIENDLVNAEEELWDEAELEIVARKAAKDRYLALQNSSYMGEIAKRIISGMKSMDIAIWVMTQAPHEFHIETSTLVMQIDSFKKVLMKEIFNNGQENLGIQKNIDVNPIDMEVIRFKDRAIVVQAMMERAVLFQEARLIKAMSIEDKLNSASGGEPVMTEQVSQEYDRYMRALERLGAYKKLIGREDDGDSAVRELTHNFKQMQKVYDLMPATSKEKFREQIEALARQRMIEEKNAKASPINETPNEQPEGTSE